jgi:hypothetical protein
MRSVMRFLTDTQVDGRFFPLGAEVQTIAAGDLALVLPDPRAHTTLCAVPARNLARLRQFRVVLVNRRVGLLAEQLRWAIDAEEIKSSIDDNAPDCEIVELDQVDAGG